MLRLVTHAKWTHEAFDIVTKHGKALATDEFFNIRDRTDYVMACHLAAISDDMEHGHFDKHSLSICEDFYVLCCIHYYKYDESIVDNATHDALALYLLPHVSSLLHLDATTLSASTRPAKYPEYLERIAELLKVE